jgi:hypothetical protein
MMLICISRAAEGSHLTLDLSSPLYYSQMPLAEYAFAGYTIVRLLDAHGMGAVYLGQHPRMPRREALKVLPESVSADRAYRERFNREVDIAATGVHDRGQADVQQTTATRIRCWEELRRRNGRRMP